MDAIAGRSKWSGTDKKCKECNGIMVKVGVNVYACTKCGLNQHSGVKKKFTFRKYVYPKYSQQIEKQEERKKAFTPMAMRIEKQWEGKSAFTPSFYDKTESNKTKLIMHSKSKNCIYQIILMKEILRN